jgi:hypothetical protein
MEGSGMKKKLMTTVLLSVALPLVLVQPAGAFANTAERTAYVKQEIQNANPIPMEDHVEREDLAVG